MLDFILNIYYKIKSKEEQKKLFSKVEEGDMIWAKMPLKKKELKTIQESHRIRPYLVVKKIKNYLICYQSSSKPNEKLNNYEEFLIKSKRYNKKRDSYLTLNKTVKIPICNIKNKYIKVNDIDLRKIEKRIQIIENRKNIKTDKFNIPINIEEGDVIFYNENTYYIYTTDNVYVYGIKIHKRNTKKQKSIKILINRKTYYIILDDAKKEVVRRNLDLKLIDIAYPEEIEEIKNIKNKKKKEKKNDIIKEADCEESKNYEIGTVFKVGNSKILYLFQKDKKYYGVDIIYYVVFPKILQIKDINNREVIEIKPKEECLVYIEELLKNNTSLVKEIRKLYDEFRVSLYG